MAIRNDRQLVIEASKAPVDNVYFVGPYGARVSFASQQRRALNLVWALRQTGAWPSSPQPRVGVVGGGIAGLTVAAALRMQGCSVWLYESGGSVLHLQRAATHRHVHPTINFWPEEPLAWTTRLPFLDWHASSCVDIIGMIEAQWNANFAGRMAAVETDWVLRKFTKGVGKLAGKVVLKFKDKPDRDVDMLFVTTGFGREKDLKDPAYRSYWEPDRIDAMSQEGGKSFVVSGTGDGGLIDALRLTYTDFMSREIALRFLIAVDCVALQDAVKDVELKAEKLKPDERSIHYHKRYTEIAENQDSVAKDLLERLKRGKNPVTLVGRLTHPYEIGAAPIHKMILALSIAKERVTYRQGTVSRSGGRYWITPDGGVAERLAADAVIVRHGAEPPVKDFVKEAEKDELERLQRQLGDYLHLGDYHESTYFDVPSIAPSRVHDMDAFVASRAPMAQRLFRERFDVGVSVPVARPFRWLELVDDRPADQPDTGPFGPPPEEVFGIAVRPAEERTGAVVDLAGRL